jgi:hypothetical protein
LSEGKMCKEEWRERRSCGRKPRQKVFAAENCSGKITAVKRSAEPT